MMDRMYRIKHFLWAKIWLTIYYFFSPRVYALWEGVDCKVCGSGTCQELIAISPDYGKLQEMWNRINEHFPNRYFYIVEESKAWKFKKELIILND